MWHPERGEFLWFDILGHKLYAKGAGELQSWQFDGCVSAAGWIDRSRLLVAHESKLLVFDMDTGDKQDLVPLEADNPLTRSNDGRADPWGGFWIGTMGKAVEPGEGAFYRYYRGELRQLWGNVTVSNAQCFSPDRHVAYFADTPTGLVQRVTLDPETGWPVGSPEAFIKFEPRHYRPDGAVVDAHGNFWCAHYGHGKVTCHSAEGTELATVTLPARQTTCPAFGGPGLTRMIVTSAWQNLSEEDRAEDRNAGKTFEIVPETRGQAEHRVVL